MSFACSCQSPSSVDSQTALQTRSWALWSASWTGCCDCEIVVCMTSELAAATERNLIRRQFDYLLLDLPPTSGKSRPKDQVALHCYYTSSSHWCMTHEVSKLCRPTFTPAADQTRPRVETLALDAAGPTYPSRGDVTGGLGV